MLMEKDSGDTLCSDLRKSLLLTYKKLTSGLAPWLLNFFIKIFCQKCIFQCKPAHARAHTHRHAEYVHVKCTVRASILFRELKKAIAGSNLLSWFHCIPRYSVNRFV